MLSSLRISPWRTPLTHSRDVSVADCLRGQNVYQRQPYIYLSDMVIIRTAISGVASFREVERPLGRRYRAIPCGEDQAEREKERGRDRYADPISRWPGKILFILWYARECEGKKSSSLRESWTICACFSSRLYTLENFRD